MKDALNSSYYLLSKWFKLGISSTSYYAVDFRYGYPDEFALFVEKMHKAGISVILDFFPVHFTLEPFDLENFDDSCVYEYSNEQEFT